MPKDDFGHGPDEMRYEPTRKSKGCELVKVVKGTQEKTELVKAMRAKGMSYRAIGIEIGISSTYVKKLSGEPPQIQTDAACRKTKRPLPPWPTDAEPGTVEKQNVMRWRYVNGFHIHHPEDAKDGE